MFEICDEKRCIRNSFRFAIIHFFYPMIKLIWSMVRNNVTNLRNNLVFGLCNYHRNCCERCNPLDNCPSNFAYLQSCAQKASICANYACARKLYMSYIRLVHVPYIHIYIYAATSFMLKICACCKLHWTARTPRQAHVGTSWSFFTGYITRLYKVLWMNKGVYSRKPPFINFRHRSISCTLNQSHGKLI